MIFSRSLLLNPRALVYRALYCRLPTDLTSPQPNTNSPQIDPHRRGSAHRRGTEARLHRQRHVHDRPVH